MKDALFKTKNGQAFVTEDYNETSFSAEQWLQLEEANKEQIFVHSLGDLYVNLLRCSRSGIQHRYAAATSLVELSRAIALNPKTPFSDAVAVASQRVGWQQEPPNEMHQSLNDIARAAITYLIEASDNHQRLLPRRTDEFVRAIENFCELRGGPKT